MAHPGHSKGYGMKANQDGFTLIELLVVIAVIGILASILMTNILGAQQRAYDAAGAGCANEIARKQAMFLINASRYATQTELTGDYNPNCSVNVSWNLTEQSQTHFRAIVQHQSGRNIYTITNERLSGAPKP